MSKDRLETRLRIAAQRPATPSEWDDAWTRAPSATYFQSREWAEVWAQASPELFSPAPECVTFSDGRAAVLPLSRRRRLGGLATTSLLSIAETYGGWLSGDVLEDEHAQLLSRAITQRNDGVVWKLNPFDPLAIAAFPRTAEADSTHAIELAPGFDVLRAAWSRGHRSAPARAQRLGVTVRRADRAADWRAYYDVYRESLARWGERALTSYGWRLFETLERRASESIGLWLAELEGEVVAGALCFYAREHAVYWHGAAREAAFRARPVHLLFDQILRDACARPGLRWFDFNPSGPLDGVRTFKARFGARLLACPTVRRERALVRAAHGSKRYLDALVRRLPG